MDDFTDEEMDDIFKYLKAQQEAEEQGEEEFTCPICGGQAFWGRSSINNHLHSRCEKCGICIMQ